MDTCSLEQGRFSGPFEQNSRIQEAFKKHSSHVSWELHAAKIRFKSNTIDPCLEVLSFSLFWVISDSNSQKPSETHRTFFCSALCPLVEMRELSFGFVVVVEPRGGAKTWDLWLGRKNVFWRYLTLTALQISQAQKKTKEKASLLIQDLGNEFQLRSSAAHGHSSRSAGLRQISHAQNSGLSNRSPLSHDLVRHAACQSVGGAAIPLRVNKDHLYILTIKVLVPRRPKSTKTIRSSIHKHNTTTQSIKKCTGSY